MAIEKIRPRVIDESGNYTFNNVTATGNLIALNANLGNIATANYVKTDNLQYANGVSWPIGGALTLAGSNTQVQFNNAGSFGSSANFVFDSSANRLTVDNITANGAALTNLTGANITGTVGNANFAAHAGNITVAAQSNITSLGTLSSLDVTGNISSGNANLGNFVIANYFSGSGNNLSNIQGSNITGAVAYATTANSVAGANVVGAVTYAATANAVAGANVFGAVSSATTAGTVTTAAQPNITSVGTLTSVTSTGNISAGSNYILGNGYYLTGVDQLAAGSADVANSIANGTSNINTPISGGNITVGIGGSSNRVIFTSTGVNIAGHLTATANITGNFIKGNGYYLTGVDQLAAGSADVANSIANGTSNISTPSSGGNITVGIGGVSNTVIFTSTGVNVAGILNVAGNAIVGNLTVSGTTTTVNSTVTRIVDPIFELGGGANGAALSADDNKDRGLLLHYYSGAAPVDAFMGWDDSNAEFAFGSNVTISSEVVTFNNYANVKAEYFLGNGSSLASLTGSNVSGQVANALVASTVYTNAQPNITSVGTLSSLSVTGDITSGNANLGNNVTANFFTGSGVYVTGVAAVTAATVTTNAQPNITSVGTLTNLIVGNATANTTFGDGTITATGNISFTGANVSLGDASNLKITGGTAGYFITTDGAGNLSWGAAVGGGGVGATGSNTQIQFNDGGVLGATANLVFNKTTNTFTTGRVVASAGANLGNNVSNLYIGGGGASQILSTDGSGNLSWIAQPTAVITVDNFTGNGVQTTFTLSTTPASINQTVINYNGAFQLRSAYTLTGPNITFSEAPANGSLIEVTTTIGATSGAGAFVTRTYTGNGVATTFTVTSGVTVSSVLVTENGLVQTPTVDYTIAGSTLTFIVAPANGITIQIRELAVSIATTNAPIYRAYTGNGVANTFTITSGLSANSLIVAENGIIQRPTTDYSVSGSNVVFVSPPASNVDIQIRELSLNGGGTSSGGSLTIKEEGSNLTTAVTSINFVGGGVTATNTGNAVTVTVPTGTTRAQAMTMGIIFGG